MRKNYLLISLFIFISFQALAGGVKGTIKTTKGEPLPFAAIVVQGTPKGTMANANGEYEMSLDAGTYTIVFQYLGFKTLTKNITVKSSFEILDITMEEQVLALNEVKVGSNNEDPAMSIMRRAIAKASFHTMQVDKYTARAYMKGSITFTSLPKLLLKMMDKDIDIKVGKPMFSEAVSEIKFRAPNNYVQRVVSARNNIDNNNVNPMSFVLSSFYMPKVANDVVSPLSPQAFAYYKFEYEGTFTENGYDVNKIKVIPRSFGDGVFRGKIYIIENTWAIHSLDLESVVEVFNYRIKQIYSPIQNVWMPVNQQYSGSGGMWGANLEGQFVTSIAYSSVAVNPKLKEPPVVVDEKFNKPQNNLSKNDLRSKKLEDLATQQKEFSTKQLRKLMKEYEKREVQVRKERKEDVAIVRSDSITIDSMAKNRSEEYWSTIRGVPLTPLEAKSYRELDSLRLKNKNIKTDANSVTVTLKSSKADTTKKKKSSFNFEKLLMGGSYGLNKKGLRLTTESPLKIGNISYNTVESWWAEGQVAFSQNFFAKKDSSLYTNNKKIPRKSVANVEIGARGRYEFGLQRLIGQGFINLTTKPLLVSVDAGRGVAQINHNNPISAPINMLTTLFFERNFMKIYEKQFISLNLTARPKSKSFGFTINLEWATRSPLQNLESAKPWIDWGKRRFTANMPTNIEINTADFKPHDAFVWHTTLTWRPTKKEYKLYNGKKIDISERNLTLKLHYAKGMPLAASVIDYDLIDLSISQSIQTGIRSNLDYAVSAGTFLNNRRLELIDFRHFPGNQFFFQMGDPVATFRTLSYYQYSTKKSYIEAHIVSTHRRLLLSQIPMVRLLGIKENLLAHYLVTPQTSHYTELGYAIDGLIPRVFPFFRVEAVATFLNMKYQTTVFRIGTTLKFK